MSSDVKDRPPQTAASLASGILGDLQHLVEQQLQLTRRQLEAELQRRSAAAVVLGLGVGILYLAAMMLCLMSVYLLHALTSTTQVEPVWRTLWASHAVVSGALAALGAILIYVGRARLRSISSNQDSTTKIL